MRWVWTSIAILWSVWALGAEAPPCAVCHADVAGGPHAHPLVDGGSGPGCADCHVGAESHAADPRAAEALAGMVTFGRGRAGPGRDAHEQAGIGCDGCHQVHDAEPLAGVDAPVISAFHQVDAASRSCAGCHADVFTEFTFNERHRLAEGAVSCISCHDPHAAAPPSLLSHGGDESCEACHADKTGPFVFEHGAQRVDGCQSCHEPHGSPNRFLLTHQREAELCYSCHLSVPQFHVGFAPGAPPRFDQDTVCTNCHTAIHGSDLDRDFLR